VARDGQHAGWAVDTNDGVSVGGEQAGVPAGPAGGVDRQAGRELVQPRPNSRLLRCQQRVVLGVIGGRPQVIAGAGVDRLGRRPSGRFGVAAGGEDAGCFGEALVDEGFVVHVTGDGPQEGDAFQAKQPGHAVGWQGHGRSRARHLRLAHVSFRASLDLPYPP
jgi:hypothetical protein